MHYQDATKNDKSLKGSIKKPTKYCPPTRNTLLVGSVVKTNADTDVAEKFANRPLVVVEHLYIKTPLSPSFDKFLQYSVCKIFSSLMSFLELINSNSSFTSGLDPRLALKETGRQ